MELFGRRPSAVAMNLKKQAKLEVLLLPLHDPAVLLLLLVVFFQRVSQFRVIRVGNLVSTLVLVATP